jgi:hypothetical protein
VDNRALIEQLAVAFRDADFAAFQQGLAPDGELTLAGESRIAGTYSGVGQVMGFIAKLHRMVRPDSLELLAVQETPEGLEIHLSLTIAAARGLAEQRLVDEVVFAADGRVQVSRLRAAGSQQQLDRLLDAHLDLA